LGDSLGITLAYGSLRGRDNIQQRLTASSENTRSTRKFVAATLTLTFRHERLKRKFFWAVHFQQGISLPHKEPQQGLFLFYFHPIKSKLSKVRAAARRFLGNSLGITLALAICVAGIISSKD
jgi:hypothetical protein